MRQAGAGRGVRGCREGRAWAAAAPTGEEIPGEFHLVGLEVGPVLLQVALEEDSLVDHRRRRGRNFLCERTGGGYYTFRQRQTF